MKLKISDFDVDDVVVLTSGNNPMTVVRVDSAYNSVYVEWIVNGVPYDKEYPPEALLLVDNR